MNLYVRNPAIAIMPVRAMVLVRPIPVFHEDQIFEALSTGLP